MIVTSFSEQKLFKKREKKREKERERERERVYVYERMRE